MKHGIGIDSDGRLLAFGYGWIITYELPVAEMRALSAKLAAAADTLEGAGRGCPAPLHADSPVVAVN